MIPVTPSPKAITPTEEAVLAPSFAAMDRQTRGIKLIKGWLKNDQRSSDPIKKLTI